MTFLQHYRNARLCNTEVRAHEGHQKLYELLEGAQLGDRANSDHNLSAHLLVFAGVCVADCNEHDSDSFHPVYNVLVVAVAQRKTQQV